MSMTTMKLQPIARRLRKKFENVMTDHNSPDRFQWDWWHLPGRYTHLRTPAEKFFPPDLHAELVSHLRQFGRKELGCADISPLWLSCYVEGCEQRLHADRPHGPWAFVLSLSPEKIQFRGGETIMIRPEILSLWNQGVPRGHAFEETEILSRVSSKSGRLLVFDPRIPHGVSRVTGTSDPLLGRLVIHGWFSQPRPFVDGPIALNAIENSLTAFDQTLEALTVEATGTIAFRIFISAKGKTNKIDTLASSMISADPKNVKAEIRMIKKMVDAHFLNWKFPKSKSPSVLTLPLSIER